MGETKVIELFSWRKPSVLPARDGLDHLITLMYKQIKSQDAERLGIERWWWWGKYLERIKSQREKPLS